jgi:hypothetical protein
MLLGVATPQAELPGRHWPPAAVLMLARVQALENQVKRLRQAVDEGGLDAARTAEAAQLLSRVLLFRLALAGDAQPTTRQTG